MSEGLQPEVVESGVVEVTSPVSESVVAVSHEVEQVATNTMKAISDWAKLPDGKEKLGLALHMARTCAFQSEVGRLALALFLYYIWRYRDESGQPVWKVAGYQKMYDYVRNEVHAGISENYIFKLVRVGRILSYDIVLKHAAERVLPLSNIDLIGKALEEAVETGDEEHAQKLLEMGTTLRRQDLRRCLQELGYCLPQRSYTNQYFCVKLRDENGLPRFELVRTTDPLNLFGAYDVVIKLARNSVIKGSELFMPSGDELSP